MAVLRPMVQPYELGLWLTMVIDKAWQFSNILDIILYFGILVCVIWFKDGYIWASKVELLLFTTKMQLLESEN